MAYPAEDDSARVELSSCRAELLSAITCPAAPEAQVGVEQAECLGSVRLDIGHIVLEWLGALSSLLCFLSVVWSRVRAIWRRSQRDGNGPVPRAWAEIEQVPPAGRMRRGGRGMVV